MEEEYEDEDEERGSHPMGSKSPSSKDAFGFRDWDASHKTMETIKANSQRKHNAVIRRERALAYAYASQVYIHFSLRLSVSSMRGLHGTTLTRFIRTHN